MNDLEQVIISHAQAAHAAAAVLRTLSTADKDAALRTIADLLRTRSQEVLDANAADLASAGQITDAFRRRLVLDADAVEALAATAESVAALPDPVGKVVSEKALPNGLALQKVQIPMGVIACIYESRPNVTFDIAVLAIKSGNACVLRGGKAALRTNMVLATIITDALATTAVPATAVQFISRTEHEGVSILAGLDQYVSVIIPRGGPRLIDNVTTHATMTVLKHREGNTHVYVDESADLDMAVDIVLDGKTTNPSVCNSLEHVVVHAGVAEEFIPRVVTALRERNVEVRGCEATQTYVEDLTPATPEDWGTEYLDFIISIKTAEDYEAAIAHVQQYSSGLSDAIVTSAQSRADHFVLALDSAAVYVNASTRFTDGGVYGLGAEVGISTAPVHGKGPMGLDALTVTRYVGRGTGHVRG